MDNEKTVYVLGAGFSIPAGGTSKDLLISKIFELSEKNGGIFKGDSIAEFKEFLSENDADSRRVVRQCSSGGYFYPLLTGVLLIMYLSGISI